MTRRLTGLPNTINHLAFSPNGPFSPPRSSGGIRLWRTADWNLTGQDADYADMSEGVTFSPDSAHLAATCYDSSYACTTFRVMVRSVCRPKAGLRGKSGLMASPSPRTVPDLPSASMIPSVSRWSPPPTCPPVTPEAAGIDNGNLMSITWSADGQTLYAAGRCKKQYEDGWHFVVRQWANGGRVEATDLPAANTLMDLQPR